MVKIGDWLLVSVYFPCIGTIDREMILNEILCELDAIITEHSDCNCLIGGDFNTNLDNSTSASDAINNLIDSKSLSRCDVLFPISDGFTYFNDSTHCSSVIDYMLTSKSDSTIAFNVLDMDINLSDHRPIMAVCNCRFNLDTFCEKDTPHGKSDIAHFRWDHAHLESYYEHTRLLLQPVLDSLDTLVVSAACIEYDSIAAQADAIYTCVVDALRVSANLFIPKQTKNFFKFWWSQELDVLKDNAIASCKAWKESGRPRNGPIFLQYKRDKLVYKKSIREHRATETTTYTNELHEALLSKSGQDFWKVWKSKFGNTPSGPFQVDGISESASIAANFAEHFESISKPLKNKRSEELRDNFITERALYKGSPLTQSHWFDAECVSNLVSKMKNGSAAGLDELTAEHLKFSHPIIICILSKLFNLFVFTGHIPASFGISYTVPIPKADSRTRALSVNDFRGISISPVISKLFEMSVFEKFSDHFITSDHQFGFKKHLGCREAIFSVRNVIETFISNGSTVNVCTLDLSKAFDRMNHYALFLKLMKRHVPGKILSILELWFSVSVSCVKWDGQLSRFFRLEAGVRQGGVLSPTLFSIYIDGIIDRVKSTNVGCYIYL